MTKPKTSKPAAAKGETKPEETPESVPTATETISLFDQLAIDAKNDAELLEDDFDDIGNTPVSVDPTKPAIKLAIPYGNRAPSDEHPLRGAYVSVYCQPLTDGHLLLNHRGCELFMANCPEDVQAIADENGKGGPTDRGAVILTSGGSYYDKDAKQWRNVQAGGFGINQHGFKFIFCTAAARRVFAANGLPFEDEDNLTTLKAQAKGSTLIARLRKQVGEFRRNKNDKSSSGANSGQPYVRPAGNAPVIRTSGPAGTQDMDQADFDQ